MKLKNGRNYKLLGYTNLVLFLFNYFSLPFCHYLPIAVPGLTPFEHTHVLNKVPKVFAVIVYAMPVNATLEPVKMVIDGI